eukprot:TRINITY_DN346_c1_g1_i2.p1 TRINITY_DN346_c1_g1~~TRINITY_DN346_c1_g1_i2.p1  ORF type:complete len:232 (-),score=20.11 TRINITY_DN346_c1_g1_i2:109-804(-)
MFNYGLVHQHCNCASNFNKNMYKQLFLGQKFGLNQIRKEANVSKQFAYQPTNAVDMYKLKMTDSFLKHPDAIQRRKNYKEKRSQKALKQNNHRDNNWWQIEDIANIFVVDTPARFQEMLSFCQQHDQLVVVKFFAPTCAACKSISPKLNQIAAQNPDITFIKFNAQDDNMRLQAQEFGVSKLPFFHIYFQGECLSSFAANLISVNRLRQQINSCKLLIKAKKSLITNNTVL